MDPKGIPASQYRWQELLQVSSQDTTESNYSCSYTGIWDVLAYRLVLKALAKTMEKVDGACFGTEQDSLD